MGNLNRPSDPPPPASNEDLPKLDDIMGSLVLIRPYEYKRNDDGTLDKGKFEKPTKTHIAEVHVLDGEHEGVHYTSLFLSGARLNPVLAEYNEVDTGEADQWTAGRLKYDSKARILSKPNAKDWAKASKFLDDLNKQDGGGTTETDEPPY